MLAANSSEEKESSMPLKDQNKLTNLDINSNGSLLDKSQTILAVSKGETSRNDFKPNETFTGDDYLPVLERMSLTKPGTVRHNDILSGEA